MALGNEVPRAESYKDDTVPACRLGMRLVASLVPHSPGTPLAHLHVCSGKSSYQLTCPPTLILASCQNHGVCMVSARFSLRCGCKNHLTYFRSPSLTLTGRIGKIKRVGIRHLEIDDALIAFGFIWYTILCVAFNELLKGPGSNLMTPEEAASLTPTIKEGRIKGSKWVFVTEHAELLTIWSMKAAVLVLYAKIIDKAQQRKLLWGVVFWVICAFLGDELALFTICRPLSQYWSVPPTNCKT